MTGVLLDIHVIMDVLLAGPPYVEAAARILALAEQGEARGHVCAASVDTLDYILSKSLWSQDRTYPPARPLPSPQSCGRRR